MSRHLSTLAGVMAALAFAAPAPPRTWLVELSDTGGTRLSIRMTLRLDGDHWELYSRPGAIDAMLNWRQRLMGRIAGKLPPRGAVIYGSGHATSVGDSLVLRGNVESQYPGRRFLKASLRGDRMRGQLTWQTDTTRVVETIDASPSTSDAALRDYVAIAASVRDTISALVFDPAIARRKGMQEFFRRFASGAGGATDDLDLVMAFVEAQPLIGISHFNFIRNPRIAATPLDSLIAGDQTIDPSQFVNFSLYGNGAVGYLRVQRWDRATPYIQRAFQRMDSARTKTLILDIISNPGGDFTSFVPATYLFRDTMRAGAVVGRPWYATHRNPPTDEEAETLPLIQNEAEAKSLLKLVVQRGGAYAKLVPRAPVFDGKVYVIIDGGTGSASEPLAQLLKETGRATLVGKRTAGAVLTALPHPVGDGFLVTVPEADYYANHGIRLEGRGVEPDVQSDDPHMTVAREIQQTIPFAALQLMAQIAFNRRQYDDAERFWSEALAIAPTEANKRAIQQRIEAARTAARPPGDLRQ